MLTTTRKKTSKTIPNGIWEMKIKSVGETIDNKFCIVFDCSRGEIAWNIDVSPELLNIIGKLGYMGGIPEGYPVKLNSLIGLKYNVKVKDKRIIKIKP